MKKITGVFVNPQGNKVEQVTIEKSLDAYYALLDCSTIDIVHRTIGGRRFDIICDDEGLLKDDPYISALDRDRNPALVGKLFVVQFDRKEDEYSLTDEEVSHIMKNVLLAGTRKHPAPYRMLWPVDYR